MFRAGNTETWQCSKSCKHAVWSVPDDFRFDIDHSSRKAHKNEKAKSAQSPPVFVAAAFAVLTHFLHGQSSRTDSSTTAPAAFTAERWADRRFSCSMTVCVRMELTYPNSCRIECRLLDHGSHEEGRI